MWIQVVTALEILRSALAKIITEKGKRLIRIDEGIDLVEIGAIDSEALLDLILEVEERSGLRFRPDRIDFETGLTVQKLADAFDGEP
jgi:acyl carrier protein